jgi:hypothetical protein
MRRGAIASIVALALAGSVVVAGRPARADGGGSSDDLVRAGVLYREGRAALDAGKVEEACASLEKSLALSRQLETLSSAARCHELAGKTATAWAERTEASVTAARDGQADRSATERDEASRLAAKLSKLEVVAPKTRGVVVKRDGVALSEAQLGVALAVDPGPHTITAEAPGFAARTIAVKVGADADRQTVTIPELEPLPATPAGSASAPPLASAAPSASGAAAPPPDGLGRREDVPSPLGVAAFVSTSVGAVGIAMGTLFGVIVLGDVSAAQDDPDLCPNKVCTKRGRQAIDEAETKATISTVGFVVGGTALAAGVTMFIVKAVVLDDAPAPAPSPAKAAVELAPGPGDVGASLNVIF